MLFYVAQNRVSQQKATAIRQNVPLAILINHHCSTIVQHWHGEKGSPILCNNKHTKTETFH